MAKKENLKSETEIVKLLDEKREALRQFRFKVSGGKVKDIKEGAKIRREIARLLTAQGALLNASTNQ